MDFLHKKRPLISFLLIIVITLVIFVAVTHLKQEEPVIQQDIHQGFTLRGNIEVREDYTQIEGIRQKGDLSFIDTKGGSATQMIISEGEENEGGNLNLDRSQIKNANENIIKKNVNLKDSSIENFNKNIVGE